MPMELIADIVGESPLSAQKGEETMRSILISFLIILMTQPPQILFAAQSPQIDPSSTYRLTNDYAGAGKPLTVSKSGDNYTVAMADTKDSLDQLWKFISLGDGKYRLINLNAKG